MKQITDRKVFNNKHIMCIAFITKRCISITKYIANESKVTILYEDRFSNLVWFWQDQIYTINLHVLGN